MTGEVADRHSTMKDQNNNNNSSSNPESTNNEQTVTPIISQEDFDKLRLERDNLNLALYQIKNALKLQAKQALRLANVLSDLEGSLEFVKLTQDQEKLLKQALEQNKRMMEAQQQQQQNNFF